MSSCAVIIPATDERVREYPTISDAALSLANDTPYGLGSYLFTTDPEHALRGADQIEAGMVFVNVVGTDAAELPFGGVKRSGFGRKLGRYATEEFVNRTMIRLGA